MGSDLEIRPAKLPGDIARIRSFLIAEQDDMNIATGEVASRLDDFLASAGVPWDAFYIAKVGKAFAGFVILSTNRKFFSSHTGVLRIHVGKRHRGTGIGSHLLREALDFADSQGLVRVTATPYIGSTGWDSIVPEVNDGVRFFTRHGFKLEGRARAFAKAFDGGYKDAALMARIADPVLL